MYLISYEIHAISYEIISQMKWFFRIAFAPQVRVVGGRGASTHLVFTGTLYLFVHISYENTHQHFAPFTFILFHMKYTLLISYEICTHLAGLCTRWVKPFYFSEHFIWNFILISSCLISIYLFELTQQYFVLGWWCVDVLVVLCQKAFAVCSGEDSRLFLGHDNSLVFSSVVFVCLKWIGINFRLRNILVQ